MICSIIKERRLFSIFYLGILYLANVSNMIYRGRLSTVILASYKQFFLNIFYHTFLILLPIIMRFVNYTLCTLKLNNLRQFYHAYITWSYCLTFRLLFNYASFVVTGRNITHYVNYIFNISGVQSAAVNVVCELARKNPKNYLSLAPVFFKLMTTSTNNWMLIKIIKLVSGFKYVHKSRGT